MSHSGNDAMRDLFEKEEVEDVLRESFYAPPARAVERKGPARPKKVKPSHYEVICISMYKEDLARLDALVARLKEEGHRKMSRSALIRFALDTIEVADLPRSY